MSRYSIICRLRWPAALLLTGVIALLDQMDVLSWGRAWPLYLILFGVLALAERAAMASQPPSAVYVPNAGYAPGYTPQPGVYPGPYSATAPSGNPIQPARPISPSPAPRPASSRPTPASRFPRSILSASLARVGKKRRGANGHHTTPGGNRPPGPPPGWQAGPPPVQQPGQTPYGQIPYGANPRDYWRFQKEQNKAAWRAQRDAWRAQRDLLRAQNRANRASSVVGPVVLITVGIIALLLVTGRLNADQFWTVVEKYWPMLLIGLGLVALAEWAVDLRRETRPPVNGAAISGLSFCLSFWAPGEPDGITGGVQSGLRWAITATISSIPSANRSMTSTRPC